MTRLEIVNFVCDKVGKTDLNSKEKCASFVKRRYEMIYDSALWKDSLVMAPTMTANSDKLVLPYAIQRVVAVRWNVTELAPVDQSLLLRVDPEIFERSGTPSRFSEMTPVGVSVLPASAERLNFVSSNSSDTNITILIRGELSNVEQVETVTLNGTTTVSSTKSWDVIYTLSKQETAGTVTVTGFTSGTTYLTLWDVESERKYARIRLHEIPSDTSKSILVLGKRRLRQLDNDLDTPLIRNIDNAIIAYVQGDMLELGRQYGKAQTKYQEGGAMLEQAKLVEVFQSAYLQQVIPTTSGEWSIDDIVSGGLSGKAYF